MHRRIDASIKPDHHGNGDDTLNECTPWLLDHNTSDSSETIVRDPWEELYAVLIPNHIQPGQEFLVLFLQSYILKLKCPTTEGGGTRKIGPGGQTLLFFPPKRTCLFNTTQGKVEEMKHRRLLRKRDVQSENLKRRLPKNTIPKVVQAHFYTSHHIQRIRDVQTQSTTNSLLCRCQQDNPEEEEQSLFSSSSSHETLSTLKFALTVPNSIPHDTILHVIVLGKAMQVHCPPAKKPGEKIYLQIPNSWESSTLSSTSSSSFTLRSNPYGDNDSYVSSNTNSLTDDNISTAAFQSSLMDGDKAGNVARTVVDDEKTRTAIKSYNHTSPSVSTDTDNIIYHSIQPEQSVYAPVDPGDDVQTAEESSLDGIDGNPSTEISPIERRIISSSSTSSSTESDPESTHIFDVIIPEGVQPGGNFPFIVAENIRVFITCPRNANPGERVRFNLPISRLSGITNPPPVNKLCQSKSVDEIRMVYKGRRWMRPLRLSDMKFIWIPVDHDDCVIESGDRFDINRSAFVRKLDGSNKNTSSSDLNKLISFIPASQASMNSNICLGEDEKEIFSARDIAIATNFNFKDKLAWFRRACSILRVDFFHGHVKIQIRRRYLLQDSINAVMSLDRHDLKKVWRFSFIDEDAIDAGGVSREWFESVSRAMFDPGFGLWTSNSLQQNKMNINSSSGQCNENHLLLFRFLGRVLGKALFDNHLISTHMIQTMYKYILGWPLIFADLESIDEEYYRHLKSLISLKSEELSELGLDFTVVDERLSMKTVVDLIPNGSFHNVTSNNLPEYLEACWIYKMVGVFKTQLCQFLLGFYDVIPETLVTVFDFQELELVMCGVPFIDLHDWRSHTIYTGLSRDEGFEHVIISWFWALVDEMDQEMRARLLQFVTGSSGVPIGGFSFLQGNDSSIRLFTIHIVDESTSFYPRSHTCFNRLDLPAYSSMSLMKERLITAILFSKGFDME